VLDKIRQRVDDAGDEQLIGGERNVFQQLELMRVTRIGERQENRARLRLQNSRENIA
jgi:hypothetical protein